MIAPRAVEEYLAHLIGGDRRACRDDVQRLLDGGATLRELYEQLFQACLYRVGDRWHSGELSVAVEHLATLITEDMLRLVFPRVLEREPNGRRAIVSCAAEEYHQVGGRIVADTLEAAGWAVHFLGANTPADALASMLAAQPPDLVAISVTIVDNLPAALRAVRQARAALPKLRIIVGGQALSDGRAADFLAVPGVQRVSSLAELDALVARWEP